MTRVLTLVRTWLLLDFFGESRRSGSPGSTLTTTIFGQSFLALVMAALLYPDIPAVPFATANLSLSTLLIGIGTLGGETAAGRQGPDRMLLGTSPMSTAAVALARALHGAFHVGLVTIGMALPPAILLAFLTGDPLRLLLYLPLACLLAGMATGALTLMLQLLRNGLGAARAALVAGTAKAVLLAGGVIAFATCLPALKKGPEALPIGRGMLAALPPWHAAHFLAAPAAELPRLLLLLGLGAVLLACAALVRDREAARSGRAGGGLLVTLHRRRLGRGPLLGLTGFVAIMLQRSAGLRARVLPLLGVPAAMVLLALASAEPRAQRLFLAMVLQFPAVYLPFLVAFLPRADQAGADWLFATAPEATLAKARQGAFLAISSHVLLPVHVLALVAMLVLGLEWSFAVPASLFALGLAVLTARGQAAGLQSMPFTVETSAESETAGDLGGSFGLVFVLSLAGAGFALVPETARWAAAAAAAGAASWQIARAR
jgi:hypothetical protein